MGDDTSVGAVNRDAIEFRGLDYSIFRRRQVRSHNQVYHSFGRDPAFSVPALRLDPEREGVSP